MSDDEFEVNLRAQELLDSDSEEDQLKLLTIATLALGNLEVLFTSLHVAGACTEDEISAAIGVISRALQTWTEIHGVKP